MFRVGPVKYYIIVRIVGSYSSRFILSNNFWFIKNIRLKYNKDYGILIVANICDVYSKVYIFLNSSILFGCTNHLTTIELFCS